jgi:glucosamine--fructose-6-phosphate aminotransferase (isomerizing)
MCGIVGAVAQRDVIPILLAGLQRLEYRGYDSAGVVVVDKNGTLERGRRIGKIGGLKTACEGIEISGRHCPYALGNTWHTY